MFFNLSTPRALKGRPKQHAAPSSARRPSARPASQKPADQKASAAGAVLAFANAGRAAWTPRDYASIIRAGYAGNIIAFRAVRMLAEGAAAIPLVLRERDATLSDHPLLTLLNRPNPTQSGLDLLETVYGHLQTYGAVLGFTDHDQPITFDGATFEPSAGVAATALESSDAYDVDNIEIAGALTSDAITDADIDRGRYDGASVRQWLVDWSQPSLRVLLFKGTLGEIRRRGKSFEVELRGLSDALSAPVGRQLMRTCDAMLGDARCGVNLDDPAFKATATIAAATDNRLFRVTGVSGFAAGWFSRGRLKVVIGPAAPIDARIANHRRDPQSPTFGDIIELEDALIDALNIGDTVTLVAGCDKRMETCVARFNNLANFRGFPHVPGDDWTLAYPKQGDVNDGGSRNAG